MAKKSAATTGAGDGETNEGEELDGEDTAADDNVTIESLVQMVQLLEKTQRPGNEEDELGIKNAKERLAAKRLAKEQALPVKYRFTNAEKKVERKKHAAEHAEKQAEAAKSKREAAQLAEEKANEALKSAKEELAEAERDMERIVLEVAARGGDKVAANPETKSAADDIELLKGQELAPEAAAALARLEQQIAKPRGEQAAPPTGNGPRGADETWTDADRDGGWSGRLDPIADDFVVKLQEAIISDDVAMHGESDGDDAQLGPDALRQRQIDRVINQFKSDLGDVNGAEGWTRTNARTA